MRIHATVDSSTVNGPANEARAVIWFQGCQKMTCAASCWNSATHDPSAGSERSPKSIVDWTVKLAHRVRGLTISGGEPFQQAPSLLALVRGIKAALPHFSIGIYTGYTEMELRRGSYRIDTADMSNLGFISFIDYKMGLWRDIKSHLDFAVMGRYNPERPSTAPLTTSSNQQLALLSNRYTLADFAQQSVEVTIGAGGLVEITGFPVKGLPV